MDRKKAYYNQLTNTLETQRDPSASDVLSSGLLIHECTHAIIDDLKIPMFGKMNEAIAFIAQIAYIVARSPDMRGRIGPPLDAIFFDILALVEKYEIGEIFSFPEIPVEEVLPILPKINFLLEYRRLTQLVLTITDGISKK